MSHTSRITPRVTSLVAAILMVTVVLAAASTSADTASTRAGGASAPKVAAPLVLNYQGRLTDPLSGAAKPDGTYQMIFALYEAESGGTAFWTETRDVSVKGGLFNTRLGEVTALPTAYFDGRALWLGITVGGDPQATPRLQLSFVAYALYTSNANNANNAARLGGQPPASYAAAGHTHDASAITGGALAYDRYSAYGDLGAEGYLGNAAGDIALNNGAAQASLNADLLDGQQGSFYQNAANLTAGTISTDRYSAYGDLGAEGYLGNAAGDIALNNGAAQASLNADLLDGQHSTAFAAASHTHSTLPIAYAFINANGTKNWGTSNVTSSWDATYQRYEITISGYSYFYNQFITVVTPICESGWSAATGSVSGKLLVEIANASNTLAQCGFQFVTYH